MNSAPKPVWVSLNVLLQIIFAGAVVVCVNLAFYRWYPPRLKVSHTTYYDLSEKTVHVLQHLKAPIEIIVFFQPDPDHLASFRVLEDIKRLLREYEFASPEIRVRYVDPDRDPGLADKLATDFGVRVANVVVFIHSESQRSRVLQESDLVEYDYAGMSVFDKKEGCSEISKYIRRDNLLVERVNLFKTHEIPADCEILVICGPQKTFEEFELQLLRDYLAKNGRIIFLLDAMKQNPGLFALLAENGVKVGNDVVLTKLPAGLGTGDRLFLMGMSGKYASHPITEYFRKSELGTTFPVARSVDVLATDAKAKDRVTVLIETSQGSWAETDIASVQNDKADYDLNDRKAPVPIAVAVEPSSAGNLEREGMRMVVIGSSRFIRNGGLMGSNMDLFMNCLNWLLRRQELIGIAPKIPQEFTYRLNAFQVRSIFVTEVIVIPWSIAVLGLLVWMRRRK
jgi:ABC-type uncharacterized transport system involved in gliding motility auxiliary subunit